MKRGANARHWLARLLCERDGATALEFSFVAVPFLLLSFGVIEFGRLIWVNQVLQDAATDGARCMGVLSTACASGGVYSASATTAYMQQQLNDASLSVTNTVVTLNANANCGGIAGFSQVSISYTFNTVVPALLTPLANGIALTAQACFPNQS